MANDDDDDEIVILDAQFSPEVRSDTSFKRTRRTHLKVFPQPQLEVGGASTANVPNIFANLDHGLQNLQHTPAMVQQMLQFQLFQAQVQQETIFKNQNPLMYPNCVNMAQQHQRQAQDVDDDVVVVFDRRGPSASQILLDTEGVDNHGRRDLGSSSCSRRELNIPNEPSNVQEQADDEDSDIILLSSSSDEEDANDVAEAARDLPLIPLCNDQINKIVFPIDSSGHNGVDQEGSSPIDLLSSVENGDEQDMIPATPQYPAYASQSDESYSYFDDIPGSQLGYFPDTEMGCFPDSQLDDFYDSPLNDIPDSQLDEFLGSHLNLDTFPESHLGDFPDNFLEQSCDENEEQVNESSGIGIDSAPISSMSVSSVQVDQLTESCDLLDRFLEAKEKAGEKCRILPPVWSPNTKQRTVNPDNKNKIYSKRVANVVRKTFKIRKHEVQRISKQYLGKSIDDIYVPPCKVMNVFPTFMESPDLDVVRLRKNESIKMQLQEKQDLDKMYAQNSIPYDKILSNTVLDHPYLKKKHHHNRTKGLSSFTIPKKVKVISAPVPNEKQCDSGPAPTTGENQLPNDEEQIESTEQAQWRFFGKLFENSPKSFDNEPPLSQSTPKKAAEINLLENAHMVSRKFYNEKQKEVEAEYVRKDDVHDLLNRSNFTVPRVAPSDDLNDDVVEPVRTIWEGPVGVEVENVDPPQPISPPIVEPISHPIANIDSENLHLLSMDIDDTTHSSSSSVVEVPVAEFLCEHDVDTRYERFRQDKNREKPIKRIISFEEAKKRAPTSGVVKSSSESFFDVRIDPDAILDVPHEIREANERMELKGKKKSPIDKSYLEMAKRVVIDLTGYDTRIEDRGKEYRDSDVPCAKEQRRVNRSIRHSEEEKYKLRKGNVKHFIDIPNSKCVKVPFEPTDGLYCPIFDPNDLTDLDGPNWDCQGIHNLCANNTFYGEKTKKLFLCSPPEELNHPRPPRNKESHAQRVKRLSIYKVSTPRFACREGCVRRFPSETQSEELRNIIGRLSRNPHPSDSLNSSHNEQRQKIEKDNEDKEKARRLRECTSVQNAIMRIKRDRFTLLDERKSKIGNIPADWYCPPIDVMVSNNNNKVYFKRYLDYIFARTYEGEIRFDKMIANDAIMAAMVHSLGPDRFPANFESWCEETCIWQDDYTYIMDLEKAEERRYLYDNMKDVSKFQQVAKRPSLSQNGWTFDQLMDFCKLQDYEEYEWMQIYQQLARTYRMYPPLSNLNLTDHFETIKETVFDLSAHRKAFYDKFDVAMEREREDIRIKDKKKRDRRRNEEDDREREREKERERIRRADAEEDEKERKRMVEKEKQDSPRNRPRSRSRSATPETDNSKGNKASMRCPSNLDLNSIGSGPQFITTFSSKNVWNEIDHTRPSQPLFHTACPHPSDISFQPMSLISRKEIPRGLSGSYKP